MVHWRDQFYFFNSDEACMVGNCTHCLILIVLLSCRVHSLESFKRTNTTSWYQTSDCSNIYYRILFPVILFYEVVITKSQVFHKILHVFPKILNVFPKILHVFPTILHVRMNYNSVARASLNLLHFPQ